MRTRTSLWTIAIVAAAATGGCLTVLSIDNDYQQGAAGSGGVAGNGGATDMGGFGGAGAPGEPEEPGEPGKPCATAGDCVEGVCNSGLCAEPTCGDGVRNGGESDVDCGAGCEGCALGQACSTAADCGTGFCADDVCCDAACDGECVACVSSKTGAATGSCANIPAGEDPDSECDPEPDASCGNSSGFCGGAGRCEKPPAGTLCGDAASCAGGVQVNADLCDGEGNCVEGGTEACAPFLCAGAVCGVACASDAMCDGSAFCLGNDCLPKKNNGQTCGATNQCLSGNCVDGRCCNSACGGGAADDCRACNVAGSLGTCTPVPSGTVCRAASGGCDVAETCNGSSTTCPSNGYRPAGWVCRAANGACDIQEVCNGSSNACPPDTSDPCCGDPCCGDPCCGDPCCNPPFTSQEVLVSTEGTFCP